MCNIVRPSIYNSLVIYRFIESDHEFNEKKNQFHRRQLYRIKNSQIKK